MKQWSIALAALLAACSVALAQSPPPAIGGQAPVTSYCWNGSAVVMCGSPGTAAAPSPLTPNASLVFPATIGNASTALFTGGTAPHNLIVFNNSAPNSVWLWCNPAGGTAAPGAGIVIPPGGGAYSWDFGITTVPTCISGTQAGGTTAASVSVSGAGG